MKKLGVIGHPISHSKSPLIHNYWIEQHGLEGKYEALDIEPDNLEKEIRRLVDEGYEGFNLTIPHKELALDFCDEIDDLAKTIGAVNTITVLDGKLHGTNTDVFGFIQNIKENARNFSFTRKPAVILGSGGAAKGCIYGLLQEDVREIRLLNRTREKAEELAKLDPRIKVMDWEDREDALVESGLLVNTTSLGMDGQPDLELDLFALPQDTLVNDIVYVPLYTPLLQECEDRGNPVVTGIGMLLHQARPAFQYWFGILPEVDEELMQKVLA